MSKVKYILIFLILSTVNLKAVGKKIAKINFFSTEAVVAELSAITSLLILLGKYESEIYNKPKNINTAFSALEKVCSLCSELFPQYKYIARPVYINLGGNKNPLVSTPIAFATTDLLMHRILPTLFVLLISKKRARHLDLSQYFKRSLLNTSNLTGFTAWTTLGAGVGWQKHKRNKTKPIKEI